jgi:hypothetical protein
MLRDSRDTYNKKHLEKRTCECNLIRACKFNISNVFTKIMHIKRLRNNIEKQATLKQFISNNTNYLKNYKNFE